MNALKNNATEVQPHSRGGLTGPDAARVSETTATRSIVSWLAAGGVRRLMPPISGSWPPADPGGGATGAARVRACVRVRFSLLALLAGLAILGGGTPSAWAASGQTLYASASSTSTTELCTSSSAPCTLTTAIDEANGDSGDTIMLAAGSYATPSGG